MIQTGGFSALRSALIAFLFSWLAVRAGAALGTHLIPAGEGRAQKTGIEADLFRFDAEYYYSIATSGYAYNGDPYSSPNIVFAPLYPWLIWTASQLTGIDEVTAGFALNKILLLLALWLLNLYLRGLMSPLRALMITTAIGSCAGAYSLHAYYSESTMLFLIAACLLAHQRRQWPALALGAAALGASRLAALPMSLTVTGFFLLRFWRGQGPANLGWAALSPLGAAAHLAFIHFQFGNPFILLPQIQKASWGFFHPETSLAYVLTGKNLLDFTLAAIDRGATTFFDIKTLNLVWTLLGLASGIYLLRRFKLSFLTLFFGSYLAFIYGTGAGSDFLISAHRFYALMLPIFLMMEGAHDLLDKKVSPITAYTFTGLLFGLNLIYCLFHTAYFNQGIWYYF